MVRDKFLIHTNNSLLIFALPSWKDLCLWFCVLEMFTVWGFYVTIEKLQIIVWDIPAWFFQANMEEAQFQ